MNLPTVETYFTRQQHERARQIVLEAVIQGKMPPAKELTCVHCGGPAKEYHHHKGYDQGHELDVIPMCRSCHQKENLKQKPKCQGITLTGRACNRPATLGTDFCNYHQLERRRVIVELLPDVARHYKTTLEVNEALRKLIKARQS